jgi:Fic family protein
MNIETRKQGKKRLYYLSHSFRDNGSVRKVRRFLGYDLDEKKIEILRAAAEAGILGQIEEYKKIGDPLHTVLSDVERRAIETLVAGSEIKVAHLSEKEWANFTANFTYDTNAIEGSAVTLKEVKGILARDEWPKERTKEDISETYGVSKAIEFIRKTDEHISIGLILEIHRISFSNSKGFAGRLREPGVEVVVADSRGNILHRGAPQKSITKLLTELIEWYKKNKKKYHPIVLAAVVHNQFESIHPFQDGNGRVGRILMNNILIKHGLPPVNIEFEKRSEYYSSLRAYERDANLRPTIELILKEYRRLKSQKSR